MIKYNNYVTMHLNDVKYNKYNNYDTQNYKDLKIHYDVFFNYVFENMMDAYDKNRINDENRIKNDEPIVHYKIDYDVEKTLILLMSIFKEMLHDGFKIFYQEKRMQPNDFFSNECYMDFFITVFKGEFEIVDNMFKMITNECLEHKWFGMLKETFDTCCIELDKEKNVKFYIISPIEYKIETFFKWNSEKDKSWSWTNNNHPLEKFRKLISEQQKDDKLISEIYSHELIQINQTNQWQFAKWFYYLELAIYLVFLFLYSLSTPLLFKDSSNPYYFEWITLGFICLNIILIVKSILLS